MYNQCIIAVMYKLPAELKHLRFSAYDMCFILKCSSIDAQLPNDENKALCQTSQALFKIRPGAECWHYSEMRSSRIQIYYCGQYPGAPSTAQNTSTAASLHRRSDVQIAYTALATECIIFYSIHRSPADHDGSTVGKNPARLSYSAAEAGMRKVLKVQPFFTIWRCCVTIIFSMRLAQKYLI